MATTAQFPIYYLDVIPIQCSDLGYILRGSAEVTCSGQETITFETQPECTVDIGEWFKESK